MLLPTTRTILQAPLFSAALRSHLPSMTASDGAPLRQTAVSRVSQVLTTTQAAGYLKPFSPFPLYHEFRVAYPGTGPMNYNTYTRKWKKKQRFGGCQVSFVNDPRPARSVCLRLGLQKKGVARREER